MSTEDVAIKHYFCPYCGARAGERCRVAKGVTKGERSTRAHASRTWGVERAWQEGFTRGRRDILDMIALHGPDKAIELLKRWLS